MARRDLVVFACLALLPVVAPRVARAQAPVEPASPASPLAASPLTASSHSSSEPGSDLRVFLMTFSAGSLIYEKFGHNTICVHDPTPSPVDAERRAAFDARYRAKFGEVVPGVAPFLPTDRAYHYGAFDFEQESFVWRFLHGRMEYWMMSDWADLTALAYANDNRAVLLQELDLPPARKLAVQQFLEWNERPENRTYRYDYYRDNCSTRVRDVIDLGTSGELRRQLTAVPTDATYRSHTRRLTSTLDPEGLFWFTSFTYVLGQPVDARLSAWEEAFLPDALSAHVRNVRLSDGPGGPTRPLVLREVELAGTTRPPMPPAEPRRTLGYGAAGLLIGGGFVGLAKLNRPSRRGRTAVALAFTLLVVPWALLWGVGATIGSYGWLATDHAASYRNENLLQMTPLMLVVAVLAPPLAFGRRLGSRIAVGAAVVGAALSVIGLVLKAFPWFWQHNGEVIAMSVPANAGLAVAFVLLARRADKLRVAAVAVESDVTMKDGKRRQRSPAKAARRDPVAQAESKP